MDMGNAEVERVVLGSMTAATDLMVRLMADFAFAAVIINPPSLARSLARLARAHHYLYRDCGLQGVMQI